jgi:hypothetical protein
MGQFDFFFNRRDTAAKKSNGPTTAKLAVQQKFKSANPALPP